MPFPWTLSYALRTHLKLRDEKVGIIEDAGEAFYCLVFQASKEQPNSKLLALREIATSNEERSPIMWIIPKSPPRSKDEIYHPAKFPENLVSQFIEFYTHKNEVVFDPMAGTGSTLVAAATMGRSAFGVELNSKFVAITKNRIEKVNPSVTLFERTDKPITKIFEGDARHLNNIEQLKEVRIDYCITSPPYWSMLKNTGSEYQRLRRTRKLLQTYSSNDADVSNISDYSEFLNTLHNIYEGVAHFLPRGKHMTVIVKNVKRDHTVYPLAWDLVTRLCSDSGSYEYAGNTFWLQDDVPLKPFAVGIHWVSNTVHQYCLHFRRR
jgi:DNA modification methylase